METKPMYLLYKNTKDGVYLIAVHHNEYKATAALQECMRNDSNFNNTYEIKKEI